MENEIYRDPHDSTDSVVNAEVSRVSSHPVFCSFSWLYNYSKYRPISPCIWENHSFSPSIMETPPVKYFLMDLHFIRDVLLFHNHSVSFSFWSVRSILVRIRFDISLGPHPTCSLGGLSNYGWTYCLKPTSTRPHFFVLSGNLSWNLRFDFGKRVPALYDNFLTLVTHIYLLRRKILVMKPRTKPSRPDLRLYTYLLTSYKIFFPLPSH